MRVPLHVVGVLLCLVFGASWSVFWSVLVFSPTLLSLFIILHYYYCLYCFYFYSLLLLLLFPQSSWLCVTGAWAGAGCGGRGLVAGLRVGLACGVLLLPEFGVSSSSPQVPEHPTSTCDTGVKSCFEVLFENHIFLWKRFLNKDDYLLFITMIILFVSWQVMCVILIEVYICKRLLMRVNYIWYKMSQESESQCRGK